VPARKKGIRLGFCQPPQTKEMGKGEDHDGEGFASTCTRRCRRSTSRSTGSDPCPPTLLDELPTENPQNFSGIPTQTTESGSKKDQSHDSQRNVSRTRREIKGFGGWGGDARTLERLRFLRMSADTSRSEGSVLEETVWGRWEPGNGWGAYLN